MSTERPTPDDARRRRRLRAQRQFRGSQPLERAKEVVPEAEVDCEGMSLADWVWISLVEFIARKRAEADSPELAEWLAREEFKRRRVHYRFLDRNGRQHYDQHLTDRFWREAKREGSALIWSPEVRLYDYSELTYTDWRIELEPDIWIYKVEVLVPPSDVATLGQPKVGRHLPAPLKMSRSPTRRSRNWLTSVQWPNRRPLNGLRSRRPPPTRDDRGTGGKVKALRLARRVRCCCGYLRMGITRVKKSFRRPTCGSFFAWHMRA